MYKYALFAGGLVLAAFALAHPAPKPPVSTAAAAEFSRPASSQPLGSRQHSPVARDEIVVYVAGAVRRPGLYRLRSGARADDAVRMAGGVAPNSDQAGVNLAQRLEDGDEVDVPVAGDVRRRRSKRTVHRSRRAHRVVGVVDLNDSDSDALAEIPGIGASIAQRIVEVREREGPFASFDELLDVAGMSASRLERARPYLRL